PQRFIDTIEANAGVYPGYRRAHAHGLCISGYFESNGNAAALSTAQVFAAGRVPVSGRLSIAGGNPHAADTSVPVRSMALLLQQADGQQWRTAMNTPPVLAVATPEGFFEQVKAARPDPATGKPDPQRMQAFFAAHPESVAYRQWAQSYKPSSSFASTRFNSINAFYLVNAAGQRQAVRWSMLPELAPQPLGSEPVAADALQVDLRERLAAGPLRWNLQLTLAEAGDAVDDASREWPGERQHIDAGSLVIERAVDQLEGDCHAVNFDPLILPSGILPSADPILLARSAAYAESYKRRTREGAPVATTGAQP
ncbi:MAG TPA: catalase family peroxidase, partial [Pseudomonas sp.]|nr:catalase family peroxidase [Pseudomonas sp.]